MLLPWPVKLPVAAAAVLLMAGLAVLMFRGSQEQQRAAQHEPTPPALADRRVAEPPATAPAAPAAPTAPATPPPDAASNDAKSVREEDRSAAVASRVDQAEKRAKMDKPEATSGETSSGARAPDPTTQTPPAARDTALAKQHAPRAMSAAAPQVIARLAVLDLDAAERALGALAARLSGTVTGRRIEGETPVVQLLIPRERYDQFTREVARLGAFRIESEAPGPADPVRIAVHLVS
jgi:hypothetical protein